MLQYNLKNLMLWIDEDDLDNEGGIYAKISIQLNARTKFVVNCEEICCSRHWESNDWNNIHIHFLVMD